MPNHHQAAGNSHSKNSRRGIPKKPGHQEWHAARVNNNNRLAVLNGFAARPTLDKHMESLWLKGYKDGYAGGDEDVEGGSIVSADGTVLREWRCPFCDLNNDVWRQTCDGCHASKGPDGEPRLDPSVAAYLSPTAALSDKAFPVLGSPAGTWECGVCTLHNDGWRSRCDACGSPATHVSPVTASITAPGPVRAVDAAAPTLLATVSPQAEVDGDWEEVVYGDGDGTATQEAAAKFAEDDEWEEMKEEEDDDEWEVVGSKTDVVAASDTATKTTAEDAPPVENDAPAKVKEEASEPAGAEWAEDDEEGDELEVPAGMDLATYEAGQEAKREHLRAHMEALMSGLGSARVFVARSDGTLSIEATSLGAAGLPTSGPLRVAIPVPSAALGPTTPALRAMPRPARYCITVRRVVEHLQKAGMYAVSVENVMRPDLVEAFEGTWATTRETLGQSAGSVPRMVFHGTATTNVGSIVRTGLVVPGTRAGVTIAHGNAFGRGIYVSPNASFSAGYSAQHLIVCAVILGNTTTQRRRGRKRNRQRGARRQGLLKPAVGVPMGAVAHSVIANNDIIVCKDAAQVLPIFVVKLSWTADTPHLVVKGSGVVMVDGTGREVPVDPDALEGVASGREYQDFRRMPPPPRGRIA